MKSSICYQDLKSPGSCKRGSSCRFEHSSSSRSICFQDRESPGSCRRGSSCRFEHSILPKLIPVPSSDLSSFPVLGTSHISKSDSKIRELKVKEEEIDVSLSLCEDFSTLSFCDNVTRKGNEDIALAGNGTAGTNVMEHPDHVVSRAHDDDIHGAVWLDQNCIVTGSKDNKLKLWDIDELGRARSQGVVGGNTLLSYFSWVTALTTVKGNILYGTRDGVCNYLSFSDESGWIRAKSFSPDQNLKDHVCKERNMKRITTLTTLDSFEDGSLSDFVLVGRPTEIACVELSSTPITIFSQLVHSNDWVYCFLPIRSVSAESLLSCVVMGSALDIFELDLKSSSRENVKKVGEVWREEKKKKKNPHQNRAHIADIKFMKATSPNYVVGACFDETIRVFDIEGCEVVRELKGHTGRCWQSLELQASIVASCADDGYVKIWDLRLPSSSSNTITSAQHAGRVSCMVLHSTSGHLLTASCPDRPQSSIDKASLFSWDLRML